MTLVALGGLMLTKPTPSGFTQCDDPAIVILVSGTYKDDNAGSNLDAKRSACSEAAWGRIAYALGAAVVGGGVTAAMRKRSHPAAARMTRPRR